MGNQTPVPLYLFAKAPAPGAVKTRLQGRLGAARCAELAELMLRDCVHTVSAHWPGKLVLTVAPDASHPVFRELADRYGLETEVQVAGDLGRRMLHVLERGVAGAGCAAVMGCDVPRICGEVLARAHARLRAGGNIIGPARDGGFWFLGVDRHAPGIFEGVQWGGGGVLERVRLNHRRLGLELADCDTLRDVDNWADLCWLAERDAKYAALLQ